MNVIKKFSIATFSILLFTAANTALAVSAPSTVVLSGINAPRGMDLDSKGNLYIADSGIGGSGSPFALSRSFAVGPICEGNSGKIFMVSPTGVVKTLVKDLPSHAGCQDFNGPLGFIPKGAIAFGPEGLKVSENRKGVTLFLTFGGSTEVTSDFCLPGGAVVNPGNPDSVSCLPGFQPKFPNSLVTSLAELWGFEVLIYNTVGVIDLTDKNPHYEVLYGQMKFIEDIFNIDSGNTASPLKFPFPTNKENDVYDLLLLNDQILAADAGANAIWSLKDGKASVAVVMPNVGCSVAPCTVGTNLPESVPTTIAQNPKNGKIYIGELAGFGAGIGRIFEADFSTTPATLTIVNIHGARTGFSTNVAMDFDKNGNLYVVEYSKDPTAGFFGAPGALVKLKFNNPHDATATVIDDQTLTAPSGITVGNGKIYVGNKQDTGINQAEVRSYDIP